MLVKLRPIPFYDHAPEGSGAEVEEQIDKVDDQIEDAKDDLAEAKASGDPKEISAALSRIEQLEGRHAALEQQFADLKQATEGKAAADHQHEMPGELKALHEHLREVEEEESAPAARRHWLYKPLRRRSA